MQWGLARRRFLVAASVVLVALFQPEPFRVDVQICPEAGEFRLLLGDAPGRSTTAALAEDRAATIGVPPEEQMHRDALPAGRARRLMPDASIFRFSGMVLEEGLGINLNHAKRVSDPG